MPAATASARVLEYLAAHTVMSIATSGPDGPWNSAVFYVNDVFRLYFVSAPDSRHSRNLAANPRVAVTIQENYTDWRCIRGVQAEGSAQPLSGAGRESVLGRYLEKFSFLRDREDPELRIILDALDASTWYGITPQRLYFVDNTRGFGHRQQIPLT